VVAFDVAELLARLELTGLIPVFSFARYFYIVLIPALAYFLAFFVP
jgi:hypothetical protein